MSNIYDQVIDLFNTLSVVAEWPEVGTLLERIALQRPNDWKLPVYVCEATGMPAEKAVTAVAAAACLQISIILVDDMLDDDPRGEYRRIGYGEAANQALALQSAGLKLLEFSELPLEKKLISIGILNQTALKTAYGQYLDINKVNDEAEYWRLVHTKSTPYFSALWQLGALFGNADSHTAEVLGQIGEIYGEIVQIHDDLNDAMATPASPDWILKRASLPILFAKWVNHSERDYFGQLCDMLLDPDALDPDVLAKAQQILINCGAVSYCIDQILQRYVQAHSLLVTIHLAQLKILEKVLRETVEPVANLFGELGTVDFAQLLEQQPIVHP
jgi:geranylgeranyl pyrophosphate synthase